MENNRYKSLRDYTDQELIHFLENNTRVEFSRLAGICSEVLRRMIARNKIKIDIDE